MIYIRIEMWPGGNKNHPRARVISEGTIANVGGSLSRGSYKYKLLGKSGSKMNEGVITNFPRKTHMAWDLLYRVLRDARGDRNV